MMRRLLPHPVLSLFLWMIWLLLNNTLAAGHVVLGAVLAVFIPWLSSAFWPEEVCIKKPFTLLRYIAFVLFSIVVANINVARLILGRSDKLQPGFFKLELRLQSPVGISMLSNTISLTPGTVSCDLSDDRRFLLIHALHIEDIDVIISDIKTRFEQPLLEIFES
jgi:multicomponent K+:H+ antiporter subunit E